MCVRGVVKFCIHLVILAYFPLFGGSMGSTLQGSHRNSAFPKLRSFLCSLLPVITPHYPQGLIFLLQAPGSPEHRAIVKSRKGEEH